MKALLVPAAVVLAQAAAPAPWKVEFDAICSQTDNAMELSLDELRALVRRCDKLKPAIEVLPLTERKFYSARLRSCRELYAFVIETLEKGK